MYMCIISTMCMCMSIICTNHATFFVYSCMYVCPSIKQYELSKRYILVIVNCATKASYTHVLWLFIGYIVSVVEQCVE